jgi:hypothetical protein
VSSAPTIPAAISNDARRAQRFRRDALVRRASGLAVALAALAMLIVAARLEPSSTGIGTHQQLMGVPPCAWIATMDMPCPTCGMTTAYAHAANGNLLAALHAQPLGGLLALGTAMAFLMGLFVAATGSRSAWLLARLWGRWTPWALGLAVVLAWGYKILSYKGVIP